MHRGPRVPTPRSLAVVRLGVDERLRLLEQRLKRRIPLRQVHRQRHPGPFAVDLVVLMDQDVAVRHRSRPPDAVGGELVELREAVGCFAEFSSSKSRRLLAGGHRRDRRPFPWRGSRRRAPAIPGCGATPWRPCDPSQQHSLSTDVVVEAGLEPAVVDQVDLASEHLLEQHLELDEVEGG